MAYSKITLQTYDESIARYHYLEKQIKRQENLILEHPYKYAHGLGLGKWRNLKGLRAAPMRGGKYIFTVAICEDCVRNGHIQMNSQTCGNICQGKELPRVVFVSFTQGHDDAYGRL